MAGGPHDTPNIGRNAPLYHLHAANSAKPHGWNAARA